jgi:hypothetical protein
VVVWSGSLLANVWCGSASIGGPAAGDSFAATESNDQNLWMSLGEAA